jgi:hypothetical protein
MFMRFFLFALLAISSSSVFGQSKDASNVLVTCYGVSTHQVPVIATYTVSNIGGFLAVHTKDENFQSPMVARLNFEFRILKSPVSIVTSLNGDSFRAEPLEGGFSRLSISLQSQNFEATVEKARCEQSTTDWRAVAILPPSATELWKIVDRSSGKKRAFEHAIAMVANTVGTLENLPEFFQAAMKFIDDQKLCADSRNCELADQVVYAAFASKMDAKTKLDFLVQINRTQHANDAEVLSGLRDSRANEADEDFAPVLEAELWHLKAELHSKGVTPDLRQSLIALAEITFSRKFEKSANRSEYLDYLFSADLLSMKGLEDILGSYGEIVSQSLETELAAQDSQQLLGRILQAPTFKSSDAEMILNGILGRHASRTLSNTGTREQLQALLTINKISGVTLVQATRELHWIDAEIRVSNVLPSDEDRSQAFLGLALTQTKEPFVLEAILETIAAKQRPITSEALIVRTIAGQLKSADSRFLMFQIDGTRRGLANDLVTYAFARKGANLDETFGLVMTVLDDARVPAQVLVKILSNLADDCPNWRRDQTSEILRAIAHHPQFFETSTTSAPEQMAELLAEIVEFQKDEPISNIDPFVIRDLLKESMESPQFPQNLRPSMPEVFDSLKEI